MREFRGRVAVVTGAAEGIGKAIAAKAAAEGMKLVLADIDGVALESVLRDFQAAGVEAVGLTLDVSQQEGIAALADLAFERFGNVHLLVNNAGVASLKPVWEVNQAEWDWVVGVNLFGVTHALRSFLPRMIANGEEGHVVNTASVAGLLTQAGAATYNASKHAVVAVSEGLHHDLALRGARIRVSVLCPGWVKTRITECERYGSETSRTESGLPDPVLKKIGLAVRNAVEHGLAPEQVAEDTFQAVIAERFYILTHPDIKRQIRVRMEDILNERNPTFIPMN
jgi:NAD(P)-dependent dehydrogenase (short-subunit alcohol dehydrogenase family)